MTTSHLTMPTSVLGTYYIFRECSSVGRLPFAPAEGLICVAWVRVCVRLSPALIPETFQGESLRQTFSVMSAPKS